MTTITTPKTGKKKPSGNNIFKKVSTWLHLWLGLVSGIIVVIVCLCACTWVFNEEITSLLEPETKIAFQQKPVLLPSRLMHIADSTAPGKRANYATYRQGNAIYLALGQGRSGNTVLRIDPYSGKLISKKVHKAGETDFFRTILNGHRFLWLPPAIGRPIVNYGTLTFVIILITGLVLWWPKKWNKTMRQQSFKIKWNASFKRVNYDLHNVFGFYAMLVLLAIALTGMVYGIQWYSKGVYWVSSGGQSLPDVKRLNADSSQKGRFFTPAQVMDKSWNEIASQHPEAQGFYYSFPDTAKASSTIGITIYPTAGKYYNNRSFSFDQHTGKRLVGNPVYEKSFEEAGGADKLRRMNYDIHVGSILGLPGKILAFCAALIGASLPVTGFLIWLGRKKKMKKPLIAAKAMAASTPGTSNLVIGQ